MPNLVIDAGHGGTDSGAVYNNRIEKIYNLASAMYLHKRFLDLGIDCKLTRTSDDGISNADRVTTAKEGKVCFSCHLNASPSHTGNGSEIIHSLFSDGKLANAIKNEWSKLGQPVKTYFRKNDKGTDYYYMQRLTGKTETLILEFCYLDNDYDFDHFVKNANEYYEGVIRAYCQYTDVSYSPPTNNTSVSTLYTVQVGSFSKRENADLLANELKNKGYPVFVKSVKKEP